jgi:hypothetical protein
MTRFNLCALMFLASALLLGAARPAHAAESYDNCTGYITSLPATINSQGTWCLKQDLTTAITSGAAITVNVNNVTIDCNDFKLGGLAAGIGTSTYGIFSQDRLNGTVRHCNIRGFFVGVAFVGTTGGGHAIEDNRFDGNTRDGMIIEGDGSVIQRNRVFDTGGTTGLTNSYGIYAQNSVDIVDNTVSGVVAIAGSGGDAYGIATDFDAGSRIIGNGVSGLLKDGAGKDYGIYNLDSDRISMRDNDVLGDGSVGSVAFSCATATGSTRDNVISGFASAIATCTDSGGNTVIP